MASLFRGSARQAEAFAESFDVAGGTCAALAPRQPLIRVQTYYGGFAIFKNRCALLENSRRYKERGPAVTSGFIKIQQACQSDRVEKDEEEEGGGRSHLTGVIFTLYVTFKLFHPFGGSGDTEYGSSFIIAGTKLFISFGSMIFNFLVIFVALQMQSRVMSLSHQVYHRIHRHQASIIELNNRSFNYSQLDSTRIRRQIFQVLAGEFAIFQYHLLRDENNVARNLRMLRLVRREKCGKTP